MIDSTNQQREGVNYFGPSDHDLTLSVGEVITEEKLHKFAKAFKEHIKETLATERERVLGEVEESINNLGYGTNGQGQKWVMLNDLEKVLAIITSLKEKK